MTQLPSSQQRPQQMLHVDDDPNILRLVRKRLEHRGISVISVADSRQTIPMLRSTSIQAVLLDIDMPYYNGIEVLKQIKEFNGNIQVIMLTGLVSQLTVIDAMSYGAEYCLFKPVIEPAKLIRAIDLTFNKIEIWQNTLRELMTRREDQMHLCRG